MQFDIDTAEITPNSLPARYESGINDYLYFVLSPRRTDIVVLAYTADADPDRDLPRFEINVYRPGAFRSAAEINWPSIGSSDIIITEAFAEALQIAGQIARKLDAEEV